MNKTVILSIEDQAYHQREVIQTLESKVKNKRRDLESMEKDLARAIGELNDFADFLDDFGVKDSDQTWHQKLGLIP